jgi:SpoU rRNA methylase family enzyme
MKKILKIIAFQIGVDVLGFPNLHKHIIVFKGYITTLHETYHKSIKHN